MKSIKKSVTTFCMAIGLLFLVSSFALAAPPDNFTCKFSVLGLQMPLTMTMAKMGNKSRVENAMREDIITINLMDQKKSTTMNTKNKTYFEYTTKERTPSIYNPNTVIEKKKTGSGTFDGHPCIKYNAVFYSKDKPEDKYTSILWEAQDLRGLPIKNEVTIPPDKRREGGPDKFTSELKEIKVGAAKAAMFEVPKGYKKVGSIAEVMGGDIGEMMKQMQKNK